MSSAAEEGLLGSRIFTYVLCLGHIGYLVWYFGWVWTMTQWQWEFTGWLSAPVPDPASWVNRQFTPEWYLYGVLIFNLFPAYAMLWIMVKPQYNFRYFVHAASVALAGIIDFLLLIWYILIPWIWENNSTVWPFSTVNSVDFCCKNWGAVASSYCCHNVHDCLDLPTTPTIRLHTNPIFEDHLLAIFVLLIFLLAYTVLNWMVRSHGSVAVTSADSDGTLPQPTGSAASTPPTPPNGDSVNLVHLINTVYVALACVLLLWGLLVLDVRYTHQYPATGPVGIRSARDTVEAVGLVMSATIIVMPAFILIVMALWRTRWLILFMFVLIVLLALVHLFSFLTMIYSRGTANRPGQPNSMANHPLRCCAGDVYTDPQSECDNAGPCNLPLAPLPNIVYP